jgi:hypothetical protein
MLSSDAWLDESLMSTIGAFWDFPCGEDMAEMELSKTERDFWMK